MRAKTDVLQANAEGIQKPIKQACRLVTVAKNKLETATVIVCDCSPAALDRTIVCVFPVTHLMVSVSARQVLRPVQPKAFSSPLGEPRPVLLRGVLSSG